MPDGIEPSAMGQLQFPGLEGIQPAGAARQRGAQSRTSVNANADISIPKVDALSKSIDTLLKKMSQLRDMMVSFSSKKAGTKMAQEIDAVSRAGSGFSGGGGTVDPFGNVKPNVWQGPSQAEKMKIPLSQAVNGAGGAPGSLPATSPGVTDVNAATQAGTGIGGVAKGLLSGNPLQMIGSAITAPGAIYGSLAGSSLQYAYNRINGPGGNMNAMLQLAQALAPNVTMMQAAGANLGPQGMQRSIEGMAQRMPIMGTQQDMLNTVLAGQSVGALMQGTPGRAGFFEAARQAQVLNPGQAPGTIAGTLAGYLGGGGNQAGVQAQKFGAMFGEGAFTMVGAGGSYKSLAEWASAIMKFLEQHRPGGMQGKSFTKAELITQNFPGSNINAWFQFMQVPQGMVDYWWQYALTETGSDTAPDKMTSDLLQKDVTASRGTNLGYEQLRTATASTRRDFLFGNQMYTMYAANASANRRFNVGMQGADQGLAAQLSGTNLGRMLALMPTPILDMLMPILTQLVTSPIGGAAMGLGGLLQLSGAGGDGGGGGIAGAVGSGVGKLAQTMIPGLGIMGPMSDIAGGIGSMLGIGDPVPYGEAGGTNLAHLSPDLASKVAAMMSANPSLQVSSGYRDTGTQNRLRAKGATAVGSNKSAHTRGWAVDLGPASQMPWLMQNAGKFGLQTAAGYGEPWHIQRAGTPLVGDPGNAMPYGGIGDFVGGVLGGVVGDIAGPVIDNIGKSLIDALANFMGSIMDGLTKPLTDLVSRFVSGGDYSSMVNTATGIFSAILTRPMGAIANLLGPANKGDNAQLQDLITGSTKMRIPVVGSGFTSSGTGISSNPIFGDPMDAMAMAASPTVNAPVLIFHAPITIQGGAGGGIDATKLANQLADRLQGEVAKREWLVQ